MRKKTIGYDAKRIVRNGTGLGSYGRTLVNDLAPIMPDTTLRLYAPDAGLDDLRCQVQPRENVRFCYPRHLRFRLQRDWWRMKGVVKDLRRDGVELYHGLSGELPEGLSAAGIPGVVTVHDLIFLRHPEFYPAIDAFFYKPSVRVRSGTYYIMATSPRTGSTWSIRAAAPASASLSAPPCW